MANTRPHRRNPRRLPTRVIIGPDPTTQTGWRTISQLGDGTVRVQLITPTLTTTSPPGTPTGCVTVGPVDTSGIFYTRRTTPVPTELTATIDANGLLSVKIAPSGTPYGWITILPGQPQFDTEAGLINAGATLVTTVFSG